MASLSEYFGTKVDSDKNHHNKTILFIDDEKFCQLASKIILESAGFKVLIANSGTEALEILATNNIDLVLVDLIMPDMLGLDFVQQMRLINSHDIPIILQSGANPCKEIDEMKSIGIKGHIIKPYNKVVLLNIVNENI